MPDDQNYGGRYHIEGVIGDGGMARVYRARDTRLERTVAIKVLRDQFTSEPEFVARFKQEARLAASLAHPNIVGVFDVGEEGGRYYMVMEYVPGENLKQIIAREAPMPLDIVISYMRQLAAALDYAHSHGVIHRDIKPENILVTAKREAKVGDFGIARALASGALTAVGTVLGSVSYFSPEQAEGQPATAESDLYAAGIILYELLTGRVPFAGPNPIAVAMAQVNDPPVSPRTIVPSLSPAVDAVVLKALAKDPADRFHSGFELIAALTGSAQAAPSRPTAAAPAAAPAVAAAIAPTMIASPQMMAAVPRQQHRSRGSGGAAAALITTVALLIAAVLVFRTVSNGGGSAGTTATTTPSPTHATSSVPTSGATTQPVIALATASAADTATAPASSTLLAPTTTAAAVAPVVATATTTAADTATTPATETPGTATPSPSAGTQTPGTGTTTPTAGSAHGATAGLVTSKDVDPAHHYAAVGVTSSFPAGTTTVYAVAAVHGKAKGDKVQFTWGYPDGSSYSYDVDVAKYTGDMTVYAELNLHTPGAYTVTASINGQALASAAFTVGSGSATGATDTPTASGNTTALPTDTAALSGAGGVPTETPASTAAGPTETPVPSGASSVPTDTAATTPTASSAAPTDTPTTGSGAPIATSTPASQ